MIDTKKVQLMTRVASYEKSKGNRDIKMFHYRKTSYLALKLLETWISTTLVFVMIDILYGAHLVMDGMSQGWQADYITIGKNTLLLYCLILFLASGICIYCRSKKYDEMQQSIARYDKDLQELQKYFSDEKQTVIYGEADMPQEAVEENIMKD